MSRDAWFDSLTAVGLRDQHAWLANLPRRVDRIINFGCLSGSEPLALLWTLDANEVAVVEIEQKFIDQLLAQVDIVEQRYPESLQRRTITHFCRDMTMPIPELPDDYFDLAYCENVLYALPLQGDPEALDRGIDQMVRTVKPGGFVIAVEPKFGVRFESRDSGFFGIRITLPFPMTDPTDMGPVFASKPLTSLATPGRPPHSYCFRKP